MSLTQFNRSKSTHEVLFLVPSMDRQTHATLIKETLNKQFPNLLGVTCDKNSHQVKVTFSKNEDIKEISKNMLDTLERKGFRGNEIQTALPAPEVATAQDDNDYKPKRLGKK